MDLGGLPDAIEPIVVLSEVSDGYLGLDGTAVTLADLARVAARPTPEKPAIEHSVPTS